MIKRKDGTVVYLNSTFAAGSRVVQVMSDIWEHCQVVHSIDAEGVIREDFLENLESYEIDVDDDALIRAGNHRHAVVYNKEKDKIDFEATVPAVKGRTVKIMRGKVGDKKGVVGKVIAVISKPYSMGYRAENRYKLGIALTDRMVPVFVNGRTYQNHADVFWVWAHNCDVVDDSARDYTPAEDAANRNSVRLMKQLADSAAATKATGGNGPVHDTYYY